jgi:hypothetical protein
MLIGAKSTAQYGLPVKPGKDGTGAFQFNH